VKEKEYAGLIIKQIHDALGKVANKELQANGITFSQIHMLWTLKKSEGGTLTLKELEKSLRISQPTTLGIAKRLEQKGLVKGSFDSADKRIKYIKIAPKGENICRKSEIHMDETEEKLVNGLTRSEKVLLYELLSRLHKNIEA